MRFNVNDTVWYVFSPSTDPKEYTVTKSTLKQLVIKSPVGMKWTLTGSALNRVFATQDECLEHEAKEQEKMAATLQKSIDNCIAKADRFRAQKTGKA